MKKSFNWKVSHEKFYRVIISVVLFLISSCAVNNPFSPTDFDFSAPKVVIYGAENGKSYSSVILHAEIEKGVEYDYKLNGKNYIPYSIVENEGIYRFTVSAVKLSNGQTAEETVFFTIKKDIVNDDYIKVISPNGGETIKSGENYLIKWESSLTGNVRIDLYKSNEHVKTIASSVSNNGSYQWKPDEKTGGRGFKIRITSIHDVSVSGMSADVFDIEGLFIKLNTLESGKSYEAGLTYSIKWESNAGGNVRIELHKDNILYKTIASSVSNSGEYKWKISPDESSGSDYRLVISSLSDSTINDKSAEFSISGYYIDVDDFTSAVLEAGGKYSVKWVTNSGSISKNVKIELLRNGSVVEVLTNSAANNGSYLWTLSDSAAGGDGYRIRVTSVDYGTISGVNSSDFRISGGAFLKITAPNAGEKVYIGTVNTIRWESSGVTGNVKIELYEDSSLIYTIAQSVSNSGSYDWLIEETIMSAGVLPDNFYRIRVTSISNSSIFDESKGGLEFMMSPNIYFLLDTSGSMTLTINQVQLIKILKDKMDAVSEKLAKNFNIGISTTARTEILPMKKGWTAEEIRASYAAIPAAGGTPTGEVLDDIRTKRLFEVSSDPYDNYRRKAVVVITDGEPNNYQYALRESIKLSYNENIPVYYLGFSSVDGYGSNSALEEKLQELAVYGGTDNESSVDKNWYPINEDGQFEEALNQIMYGNFESMNDNVIKLSINAVPDSGHVIYFYGDANIVGAVPSGNNILINRVYPAEYDTASGRYYALVRDVQNFNWSVFQRSANTGANVFEKLPLHTSSIPSAEFNGWETSDVVLPVQKVTLNPEVLTKGGAVTVSYKASLFTTQNPSSVIFHWGINNWQVQSGWTLGGGKAQAAVMVYDGSKDVYTVTITIPANANQLDFVFNLNNGSNWDNNNGADWHINVN